MKVLLYRVQSCFSFGVDSLGRFDRRKMSPNINLCNDIIFNNENPKNTALARSRRLKKAYEVPMTEFYLSFYASALPLFTHYSLSRQK